MTKLEEKFGSVGLISTISPDAWPDAFINHASANLAQARSVLQTMGFKVHDCGIVARTWNELSAQTQELDSRGINVLVIQVSTWAYANGVVGAALRCRVPVVIWADPAPGRYSICGGGVLKGSFDEIGTQCSLVYGGLAEPETVARIRDLCLGAAAATRLRGLRFGLGGTCSMGMYTSLIDASQWSSHFGVTVDGFEQAEVIRRAELVPESDAHAFLDWMRKTFGRIDPADAVMVRQIRLYIALQELVRENGYDFIAVKCLPEMPACYTTFCLAHSLLNSTSDACGSKDAVVCSCEADANGALTMQLLRHVTGGAALFADVLQLDRKDNLLTLANCGSQTVDFATNPKDVWWMKECLPQFEWQIGGTHPQYVSSPGRMTLARLSRVQGKYVMLIAEGEAVAADREKLRETNYHLAHTFVHLDAPAVYFVRYLRSNHIHAVYGSVSKILAEACRVLEIEPIII